MVLELCLDFNFIDCDSIEDDGCVMASNDHDVDIEIIEIMNRTRASYFYYDNSTIMEHNYGKNSQNVQDSINSESKETIQSAIRNIDVRYKNKGVKRKRGKKKSEYFTHHKKRQTEKSQSFLEEEAINRQIIKTEPSEDTVETRKYRFYCITCEITYLEFSEDYMKKCPQCNTKIRFQCNCCAKVFNNRFNAFTHSEKMYKIALLERIKTEKEKSICEELKKNPTKSCTKPNLIKLKQEPVEVTGLNKLKVKNKKDEINGVTENMREFSNPMFKVLIKEWSFYCKPCNKSYRKYYGKNIYVCPKCSTEISYRCRNCKKVYDSRIGATVHSKTCFKRLGKENKRLK